jgi:hypothetical protein
MVNRVFLSVLFAGLLFAGTAFGLQLTSPAFDEGEEIPLEYTGKGENISPPLSWNGVPEGTKSFVLIMEDPDAPLGTWIHWVVYDIPSASTSLEKDISQDAALPDGTKQGLNSFRWTGYGGPNPPPGKPHRYVFSLYAVDMKLENIPPASNMGRVLRAIQGHILGWARLTGTFGR